MKKFDTSAITSSNHFKNMDRSELRVIANKLWQEMKEAKSSTKKLEAENKKLKKALSGEIQESQKKEIWRHIKPCPIKAKLHVLYGDLATLESLVMNTPNVSHDG